ncbi:MAG: succinylglutamate desuccinylase/aspartoacylase family protein [Nitrospinota bacterium]|nr:succinylglutamate desuccinylase/aspartoacylase family protein [Nitrospinota bacterium]MDP7370323.1 succinylglutamate desuccinylase/aspartoacylase family protein [Nitrospinota bacterium]MDP7664975.1 succinylglutamate desuccinylase/aspartoacylase family protein [Nitrospinota bacterium]HJP14800.1 succinylglutamate desuccinylase/aspartoacylase family protein [Nitrospinota bacterium]
MPIAGMLGGGETALPLHCVRGASSGPVLAVQACVHGDEPQPVRALHNVLKKIDAEKFRGTLLMIPVANPFAFADFSRQSPDQHEQTNLWGAFPGNPKGTLTQRYAAKIREALIDNADFFAEFHSGGRAGRIQNRVDMDPGVKDPEVKGSAGKKARTMALAFARGGAGLVHGVPLSKASAPGYALSRGIPAISVEIGGAYLPEAEEALYRRCLEEGLWNLMVHLGMLAGRERRSRLTYFDVSHRAEVNPSAGGYLLSRKTRFADIGGRVRKGQLLGEMLDPYTLEVTEELRSPSDGILFFSRCSGPVEVGNKGFAIATKTKKI